MCGNDFLLVLAQDNVMCFTGGGCNTKLSCLSSARRHYNKRHGQAPASGSSAGSGISNEQNTQGYRVTRFEIKPLWHFKVVVADYESHVTFPVSDFRQSIQY